MDAKNRCIVGVFLAAFALCGCQSANNATKAENEQSLRDFTAINGIPLQSGPVNMDELIMALRAKGESDADEIIREAKTHDDGTAAGLILFKKEITGKMDSINRNRLLAATCNIANEFTPGFRAAIAGRENEHNMQNGATMTTHRQLDVAILGEGFLIFRNSDTGDCVYTRYGSLALNANSQIVAGDNETVLLEPPITFPTGVMQTQITVEGEVKVQIAGSVTPQTVGQMQLAIFQSPEKLATQDGVHFTETSESGPPALMNPGSNQAGILGPESLEASNVEKEPEMLAFIRYSACYVKLYAALKGSGKERVAAGK